MMKQLPMNMCWPSADGGEIVGARVYAQNTIYGGMPKDFSVQYRLRRDLLMNIAATDSFWPQNGFTVREITAEQETDSRTNTVFHRLSAYVVAGVSDIEREKIAMGFAEQCQKDLLQERSRAMLLDMALQEAQEEIRRLRGLLEQHRSAS